MKKSTIIIGAISILLLSTLVILTPFFLWLKEDRVEMNILIVNKTVPDHTYREHKGLVWLLNHWKVVKKESQLHYSMEQDYYGFVPLENQQYEIRELPKHLQDIDLIYIADTYGVYEQDYDPTGDTTRGSEKIYGGLTLDELDTLKQILYRSGATLIAEFNSFASPTPLDTRHALTELLSIEWTEWIGRYFSELDPVINDEVPQWALQAYEEQYQRQWDFSQGGFVLVHEDGTILILEDNIHSTEGGIRASFTDRGKELFNLDESPPYHYWFDIIVPHHEEDVLAYYDWKLTDEGKELVAKYHIPEHFAAVVNGTAHGLDTYYFAGDYVDYLSLPSFYRWKGIPTLQKWFTLNTSNSEEAFFWHTYVPMMKSILEIAQSKQAVTEQNINVLQEEHIQYSSRIQDAKVQYYQDGEWVDLLVKGVNIGIAKPGYWPGETAITEEEYYRWFQWIGEMNANSIRVYTLHPPAFYRALDRYNRNSEHPLFIFHGVWIEEEGLEETLDAFDPMNIEPFKEEIARIIDVIHGNAEIEARPGHASGSYSVDISPYVVGWILGIEWYPLMVENTNQLYSELGEYDGKHVYTEGAQPFEYWMAEIFDFTLEYEQEAYGWQRPISFTNWVTTDLLNHPSEPSEEEDLVGVDPNTIKLREHIKTGQFASYHVYPYYPDFLNYEPRYLEYRDHRGEPNNYAAYLRDLHAAHSIPVLIAEFGVPGSRGLTHVNPFGWNQGFISEQEQGEINVRLFEDIIEEGMLGGLLFAWHDEWFKRTWNTMELDDPDRRPYWSNAQTNEQQFGILSFDRHKIKIDGQTDDWDQWMAQPLYQKENDQPLHLFHDGYDGDRTLQAVYVDHDERYLYIRLDYESLSYPNPFVGMNTLILLDTIKQQGNTQIPFRTGLELDTGIDFIVHLNGLDTSRVLVDSYYDMFYYQYGYQLQLIEQLDYASTKNNGVFHPIRLALNKAMEIPSTQEFIPFTDYETGKLRHGIGSPLHENYDSLADFYVHTEEAMIELRLPWQLLNVKDPSLRTITGDMWQGDFSATNLLESIGIAVVTVKPDMNGDAESFAPDGVPHITDSFPSLQQGRLLGNTVHTYTWEEWNQPMQSERLKQTYYIIQEAFSRFK